MLKSSPASIYLFKVKEGNTRRSVCGICSELRGIFRTQSNISLRLLVNYFCRKAPLLCSIWVLNKSLNWDNDTRTIFYSCCSGDFITDFHYNTSHIGFAFIHVSHIFHTLVEVVINNFTMHLNISKWLRRQKCKNNEIK